MRIIRRILLKQLIKKSPPRNFNFGDPRNDFVSVEIHDEGDSVVLIRGVDGSEAICLEDPAEDTESRRPIDNVLDSSLDLRVFKGNFLKRCFTLWTAYYFSYLWGTALFRFRQSRYEKSLGDYRGRMEVLEAAVIIRENLQRDLERIEDTLRVSAVMKELYGEMISNSARQVDILDNVRMKLASFLTSGEISTQEDRAIMREFVVNPTAYSTLSNYAAEERRHYDSLKTQRGLIAATVLLALVALIQLAATLKWL